MVRSLIPCFRHEEEFGNADPDCPDCQLVTAEKRRAHHDRGRATQHRWDKGL